MIRLTHDDARDLLNAGSAELNAAERETLAAHLKQCADCQVYGTEVSELRTALTRLFREHWQAAQAHQASGAAQVRLKQRQTRQHTTRRINTLAYAVSLIVLAAAVLWLLNRSAFPATPAAPAASTGQVPEATPFVSPAAPAPGSQISLAGIYGAEQRLWPGSSFTLTLRWQSSAPITASYRSFVHVLDEQGNLVATSDGVPGGRETITWAIGETIDDVHLLSLPNDVKPGPYQIVAGLYDARTGVHLRLMGQDSVPLMTIAVQSMQQPIHQDFGDFATLLGVDGLPDSVAAGETITPTLYWRARAATTVSYLISLQVFGANKSVVAQVDSKPGNGAQPTTSWQPGEIIVDSYALNLPPDLQPGQYRLLLLMVDPVTKTQVFTREGNGTITLTTFEVQAKTSAAQPQPVDLPACPVTVPNGNTPPGETHTPDYHGNGALWTVLWPNGNILMGPQNVEPDGSLSMKFVWWRGVKGQLSIEGRRLDAAAPPLSASIPDGYGDSGIQASTLIFPTEGCWEVAGRVGDAALTFITRVTK